MEVALLHTLVTVKELLLQCGASAACGQCACAIQKIKKDRFT